MTSGEVTLLVLALLTASNSRVIVTRAKESTLAPDGNSLAPGVDTEVSVILIDSNSWHPFKIADLRVYTVV